MRKLFWFVCGFAAACLAGALFSLPLLPIAGGAALLCLAGFLLRRDWARRCAILLLGVALGAGWFTLDAALLHPLDNSIEGKTVSFAAKASDFPAATTYGYTVEVTLTEPQRGTALLYFKEPAEIAPGDTVQGTAYFPLPEEDDSTYRRSQGIQHFGRVNGALSVTRPEKVSLWLLPKFWARTMQENLRDVLPEDAAAFLIALTTGDKGGLSANLVNDMSLCGVYHAVSLSGMHISLLVGLILLLCGGKRDLAALLGLPALVLFTLLSGANSATVRAAVMQCFLLLAPLVRREYDSLTSLAAALLLLLLKNPQAILGWGLQLSFLSTLGILLFAQPIFDRLLPERWKHRRIPRYLAGGLSVSLAALLLSQPLLALYFGTVSLLAPIANLLVLWAVTLCFAGGLLTALCGFVLPGVSAVLAVPLTWLYRYIAWIVRLLAKLPFCAVYVEALAPALAVLFTQTAITVALIVGIRWYVPLCCSAVVLAAGIGVYLPQCGLDGFTALDVGQGQCLVWQNDGRTILFDCGGDDPADRAVRWVRSHGATHIEYLVLSHFDTDHVNGVPELLHRMPPEVLLIPAEAPDCDAKQAVLTAARSEDVPIREISEMTTLGDDFTVYPPLRHENENDSGLSALATAGSCDILITGDMRVETEIELIRRYDIPDLELFVAGHHGSGDSTGNALLDLCRPEIVLISVGTNPYGQPEDQVLRRISQYGGTAYRTDENGNLTFRW